MGKPDQRARLRKRARERATNLLRKKSDIGCFWIRNTAVALGLVCLAATPTVAMTCGQLLTSSLNPIAHAQKRIVATIKRNGSCGLLPRLHSLEHRYGTVCRQLASGYPHCRITCSPRLKTDAQVEAELRPYCKKPIKDTKHCRDLPLARTYLTAAEAAVRVATKESNYNNWSIAEDRFRDAAKIFRCRGMAAEARAATAKADKVKRIYSSLPGRTVRRPPRKSPTTTSAKQKQQQATCRAAQRHIARLKTKGGVNDSDLASLRNKLKAMGCS